MGCSVFILASGTSDIASSHRDAIASSMRFTFTAATLQVVATLDAFRE